MTLLTSYTVALRTLNLACCERKHILSNPILGTRDHATPQGTKGRLNTTDLSGALNLP